MSATVSVIIPTFDRAGPLRAAIDSVLDQSYGDFEVLVVDDGSTDGTGDLVRSIAERDPRVAYHHQPNAGASAARNTGIRLAQGTLIAFLDSDDVWRPWHLRLMVDALAEHPEAGLICTNVDLVGPNGKVVARRAIGRLMSAYRHFPPARLFATSTALGALGTEIPAADRSRRLYAGDIFSAMIMGNLVLTSSVVMRRDRLEETGSFDQALAVGEDYDFFLRASRAGPVLYADLADVRYRVGTPDKLASPSTSLDMATAYLRVIETTLDHDRERVQLSDRMVALARAKAHSWIGEQQLVTGHRAASRREFARSLEIRPGQPRVAALLAMSVLPAPVIHRMADARRAVRRRLRRHH